MDRLNLHRKQSFRLLEKPYCEGRELASSGRLQFSGQPS